MVHDHVGPGELSADDLALNCMTLLSAGHETTANMIALGTLVLLEHPEVIPRLEDPRTVANATEELLRYLTIVHDLVVRVVEDDAVVGGQAVSAGEGLFINLALANRDPVRFENPDTFDVDREHLSHLAFGYGIHQCLGQILAPGRAGGGLHVAVPAPARAAARVPVWELDFRNDMSTYGVHRLPVTW